MRNFKKFLWDHILPGTSPTLYRYQYNGQYHIIFIYVLYILIVSVGIDDIVCWYRLLCTSPIIDQYTSTYRHLTSYMEQKIIDE